MPPPWVLERLGQLRARLPHNGQTISYQQAQDLSHDLAARIEQQLGGVRSARKAHYAAIPRGGFFVLGFLSYYLDLDRRSLAQQPDPDRTLVVVDDCALSGRRFSEFLRGVESQDLILATLCAPSPLHQAIQKREPCVRACICARQLDDLAPATFTQQKEYQLWRRRWKRRFPDAYWIGLPEAVIFPWSEPDRPVWNATQRRAEHLWSAGSPGHCLKNWSRLGLPPREGARPRYRLPEGVLYSTEGDRILFFQQRSGEIFGLDGMGAEMWRALMAYGVPELVLEYLLERYQAKKPELASDLSHLIEKLKSKDLLE